ncbi:protein kinase domain-containing protein [Archangium lansingense]|uniref:protein kinase domain-containing protein n=1 Tax=Archangium lansingense TaxID=2995310 RepID=UPI003B7CD5B0
MSANVGRYQLLHKLASGGMAEVFLAKAAGPQGFEKTLVVKRILPHLAEEPSFVEMFFSEARLAALLNHPYIVQIFDFGESEGAYFLAMEYIDGPNLRMLCKRAHATGMPLPVQLCAKMISLACEGLAYAHEFVDPGTGEPLGLVHRDISPDNLLVSSHGTLKVVDFGIAKATNQLHHTRSGIIKGKVAYMAPEHLRDKPLDARADVFALGVVLYELLSGRKPFEAEGEVGLMQAILHQPPVPMSARRADVPESLCLILERALAKDRDARYGSCRELQADLERYLHTTGEPVGAWHLAQLVAQLVPSHDAAARKVLVQASPPRGVALSAPPPPETREPLELQRERSTRPQPTLLAESTASASELAQRQEAAHTVSATALPPHGRGGRRGLLVATGLLVALLGAFIWRGFPPVEGRAPVTTTPVPSPAAEPRASVSAPAPTPPPEAAPLPAVEPPTPSLPPAHVKPDALARAPTPVAPARGPIAAPATDTPEPQKKASAQAWSRPGTAGMRGAVASPSATTSLRASFRVTSNVPGRVRVNGRFVGRTPVEVRGIAPGSVNVEVFDAQVGFSKKQTFALKAGDNGLLAFDIGKARLQIWVRPYATVMLGGKSLGQTPIAPIELYEGRYRFKLVNAELGKEKVVEYVVSAGGNHILKANLMD